MSGQIFKLLMPRPKIGPLHLQARLLCRNLQIPKERSCPTWARPLHTCILEKTSCNALNIMKWETTQPYGFTCLVRNFQSLAPRNEVLRSTKLPSPCRPCLHSFIFVREMSGKLPPTESQRKRSMLIYICAVGIFMLGMSYAGVPLYRIFCQATGLGGQAVKGHDIEKVEKMNKVEDRVIRVRFNADVASSMRWNFKPQQTEVKVLPGETALAFYTARNPTSKPIVGISTYNVVPFEAGQYFNKIQCFCFEEQRLNPNEQVDMPVFFYIDPEYAEDPKLEKIDIITLSYTFFEAKEGLELPLPGYMTS